MKQFASRVLEGLKDYGVFILLVVLYVVLFYGDPDVYDKIYEMIIG